MQILKKTSFFRKECLILKNMRLNLINKKIRLQALIKNTTVWLRDIYTGNVIVV